MEIIELQVSWQGRVITWLESAASGAGLHRCLIVPDKKGPEKVGVIQGELPFSDPKLLLL
ncbi:MAG: hypothetical protein WBO57_07475 [Gammaproteobacteria bacterium]